MVEVFSTNITTEITAKRISQRINEHYPDYQVHFDLEDCDRILRVECVGQKIDVGGVIALVSENDFFAGVLPDI